MADFWSQYKNDFPDLGGFQQAPAPFSGANGPMPLDSGFGVNDTRDVSGPNPYGGGTAWSDPRVTTQPQPYQQGPGDPGWNTGWAGGLPQPPTKPGGYGGPSSLGQMDQPMFTSGGGGHGMGWQGPTSTLGSFMSRGGPARQAPQGAIQQQMQQNGGFYAPPAISRPPDQQSQQPGQVGMRSPDGQHFQYVNAEHVPHYQSRGATLYNGSSYGGGNGE